MFPVDHDAIGAPVSCIEEILVDGVRPVIFLVEIGHEISVSIRIDHVFLQIDGDFADVRPEVLEEGFENRVRNAFRARRGKGRGGRRISPLFAGSKEEEGRE